MVVIVQLAGSRSVRAAVGQGMDVAAIAKVAFTSEDQVCVM